MDLGVHCRQITVISLANLEVITPSCIEVLAQYLNLSFIDLFEAALEDEGVRSLASATKLKVAVLSLTKVVDGGLTELAASCTLLQKVHVANTKVTDIGIMALAQNCRHLLDIDCNYTGITDTGLEAIATSCPRLKQIQVFETAITDQGVRVLADHCPLLEQINLGNTGVTDDAVTYLASHCSELSIARLSYIKRNDGKRLTDIAGDGLLRFGKKLQQVFVYESEISEEMRKKLEKKGVEVESGW